MLEACTLILPSKLDISVSNCEISYVSIAFFIWLVYGSFPIIGMSMMGKLEEEVTCSLPAPLDAALSATKGYW